MNRAVTLKSLTSHRRKLVQLMQEINFGRIEKIKIKAGQPIFDPSTRIVRDIKFGGENRPRPEASADDFVLKMQAVELFRELDEIQDGTIDCLVVKHGLPFNMNVPSAV